MIKVEIVILIIIFSVILFCWYCNSSNDQFMNIETFESKKNNSKSTESDKSITLPDSLRKLIMENPSLSTFNTCKLNVFNDVSAR